MYFDTHVHYGYECYDGLHCELFGEMARRGIDRVMLAGYDLASSEKLCRIAASYSGPLRIYIATGIHPGYIDGEPDRLLSDLERLICEHKPDALGEFGLDRRFDEKGQRELFTGQLSLCEKYSLPALVHSVGAAKETYDILMEHSGVKGVLHGFSYAAEMAERFCEAGWYIGIGTTLLRENAVKIKKIAAKIPAEGILAESDCPFGYGMRVNLEKDLPAKKDLPDSRCILQIVAGIAKIRNCDEERLSQRIYDNSLRLFGNRAGDRKH